jgi:hypothetical protein
MSLACSLFRPCTLTGRERKFSAAQARLPHLVGTENSVRIDLMAELLSVSNDGRTVVLLPDAVRLAVQVEEPT